MFVIQSEQEKMFCRQVGRAALFEVSWDQSLHDVAFYKMFDAIFCGLAAAEYT